MLSVREPEQRPPVSYLVNKGIFYGPSGRIGVVAGFRVRSRDRGILGNLYDIKKWEMDDEDFKCDQGSIDDFFCSGRNLCLRGQY